MSGSRGKDEHHLGVGISFFESLHDQDLVVHMFLIRIIFMKLHEIPGPDAENHHRSEHQERDLPAEYESLKPEVSWNYEVGFNQPLATGLSLDIAAFVLKGEDLIEAVSVPGRVPPLQFQNTGSFLFKGVEAGVELRKGPWRSNLAYTLTDFGQKTRARAGSKLNVSAGATLAKLDLDVSFQHVARYFAADSSASAIPAYYTFDLRAGYGILPWLGVFASVGNLLDRQYDTFVDLPGTQAGQVRSRSAPSEPDFGGPSLAPC